MVKAYPQV